MNVPRWFESKVVIVTGSARGIGRETARLAREWGAKVVVNGRDEATVAATARALGGPHEVLGVAADVSTPEGAQRLVAAALEAWGRVDVLVNNAGLSMRGAFADLSATTVGSMVDANLLSAVWTTQAALPALRQARGRVVFISSLAGVRGFPGVSLYSATKMALAAVHESLRAEEGGRLVSGLVYLAFTENDPGKTVVGADGQRFHHQRRWSLTQVETARLILGAVARGRRKTVLTATGVALDTAQRWVPGLVDWFVGRSGGKLHAVRRSSS